LYLSDYIPIAIGTFKTKAFSFLIIDISSWMEPSTKPFSHLMLDISGSTRNKALQTQGFSVYSKIKSILMASAHNKFNQRNLSFLKRK